MYLNMKTLNENRLSRRPDSVAIWLGDIKSEEEMDDYLFIDFFKHFQILDDGNNMPESDAHEVAIPIKDLLKPFSSSSEFMFQACEKASQHNITLANAAVVYYGSYFEDTNLLCHAHAPLRFLGNFKP